MRRASVLLGCTLACGRVNFTPIATGDDASPNDTDVSIAPPVAGPILWYRFEDSPTDGALDSTGAPDGLCTTCPQLAPGRVGSAADFSSSAFIAVADNGRFSSEAITISTWMFVRSMTSQSVLAKPYQSGDVNSWQFEVDSPARACVTGPGKLCSDGQVSWSTWMHVAATWDGSTKRLYLDGAFVNEWPASLDVDNHEVVIGADYRLDSGGAFQLLVLPLDGLLDEVLFYDRVLDASEVSLLAGGA